MNRLPLIIKRLKDDGILDAIINGRAVEQRRLITGSPGWEPWEGSQTILLDGGESWEVRIKPQPREWWIGWCLNHGPTYRVWNSRPEKECPQCQIVHVVEDFKK